MWESYLYDIEVIKYNEVVFVSNFDKIFNVPVPIILPKRPFPPTQEPAYTGFYHDDLAITSDKQIWVDAEKGGWGSYTMGLLTPTGAVGKSFGIFG